MTPWREDSGPALQPQSDYAQTPECQPSLTNWKIVQRPTTVVWRGWQFLWRFVLHAGGQGPSRAPPPFLMPVGWQAAAGHEHRRLSSWLLTDAVGLIALMLSSKQSMHRQPQ